MVSYCCMLYHLFIHSRLTTDSLFYRIVYVTVYCVRYKTKLVYMAIYCRYKAKLRWEGAGSDNSLDFWVNLTSPDVHEIAWAAANNKKIVPALSKFTVPARGLQGYEKHRPSLTCLAVIWGWPITESSFFWPRHYRILRIVVSL